MPPKALADARLVHAMQEHSKKLERMGWKNMDAEEFCDGFLPLLKSLARITYNLPQTTLDKVVASSKLRLTSAEEHLLATKIRDAVKYAKKKLRDAGSGKFLPLPIKALLRIWSQGSKGKKKGCKQHRRIVERQVFEGTKVDEEASQVESREGAEVQEKDQKSKVEEVEMVKVEASKEMADKNIRDIFGLGKKEKAPLLDLISESSSDTSVDQNMVSASSSSCAPQPEGS